MAGITILSPLDQPAGANRLLDTLKASLGNCSFQHLRIAVGFAKSGPLVRLEELLVKWRQAGKTIEAVIGIDQRGTSSQALGFALQHFSETYIVHGGPFCTFHPKTYLFFGDQDALGILGSHNLTVGGTESNFESGVRFDMKLPADKDLFQQLLDPWLALAKAPSSKRLNLAMLQQFSGAGLLLDEMATPSRASRPRITGAGPGLLESIFGPYSSVPPSHIESRKLGSKTRQQRAANVAPLAPAVPTQALIIQLAPHPNGEVFLSKTAVDQNPDFFGYPFQGWTVPKKKTNPPYPQRLPDPVVSVSIFDATGALIQRIDSFPLNMVYYANKHEIRITFSQAWLGSVPAGSVMVMRTPDPQLALDYELEIFQPGSVQHAKYLAQCDQTLPSGGAALARRMGWI